MKNFVIVVLLLSVTGLYTIFSQTIQEPLPHKQFTSTPKDSIIHNDSSETLKLYTEIQLDGKLKFEAFEKALIGYQNLPIKNKDIITVIDFTLPSTDKRMYVIDMEHKKLLYQTIVSHGRNSGEKYASSFSNRHGSFQSSLGFYETQNTYQGGNGYSLVLNGLEKGINDQAKPRAVVIHGADYCSQQVINATGRLGRSYGCPALPRELTKPIINTIKDGTMLFIYSENKDYLTSSKVLKSLPAPTLLAEKQQLPDDVESSKVVLN